MYITAINKTTLLDYPNHLASTLFLQGCNFLCPFCHNRELIAPANTCADQNNIQGTILSTLRKRRHLIEGVCITGGEPTLHKDLEGLLHQIKALGLKVKLDTNGSNPKMLSRLLDNQLLDHVAMDIKNSPSEYERTCGCSIDIDAIASSLKLLAKYRRLDFSYELRTTLISEFHTYAQLEAITQWISTLGVAPSTPWYLQKYVYSPMQINPTVYHCIEKETLTPWLESLSQIHPTLSLRGYE